MICLIVTLSQYVFGFFTYWLQQYSTAQISHKCTYLFICNILGQSTVNSAQCMIAVSCNKYPYSLSAFFFMGALCYYGPWSTVATQCVALPWFYTHIKHLEENRLRISTVTQTCHYNSSYMPLLYALLWSVTNRGGNALYVSPYVCSPYVHFNMSNQLWSSGLTKEHFKGISTSVSVQRAFILKTRSVPDLCLPWTLQLWCAT